MKNIIRQFFLIVAIFLSNVVVAQAQYLIASQMNIYFGTPKTATITNSQGAMVVSFDTQGRIMEIKQGLMRMVYSWKDNSVNISMYQGQNFMDSGIIEIEELSESRLVYSINEISCEIIFKNNGAIQSIKNIAPQMIMTQKYLYKENSDVFPYGIEQSNGAQSMITTVTVKETDDKGNPTLFTNEMFGNIETVRVNIEYY